MKKIWGTVLMIGIISILAPIIIGWGVSQDILNNWTNENDWIGFWGSYIGTMIGSGVTLFVLWNTLEDNRCAREREEKIRYYNSLIEMVATFTSDAGNYLATMKRMLYKRDESIGCECTVIANQTTKSSNILDAQLGIIRDCDNINKIIGYIKPIEEEMDKIADDLIIYLNNKNKDRFDRKQLEIRIGNVMDKINSFMTVFPEIIKDELKK